MATTKWTFDNALKQLCTGSFPLLTAPIKCALLASTIPRPYSTWQTAAAYRVGDVIVPPTDNGHRYRCVLNHTSGTEPDWDTTQNRITDALWQEYGGALCSLNTWSQISTHEVAPGDGYTTGGVTLTDPRSLAEIRTIDGVTRYGARLVAEPAEWVGLTKTFRYLVAYLDGTYGGLAKPLLFYSLLDDTPADVTSEGFTLRITWSNLHYLYK